LTSSKVALIVGSSSKLGRFLVKDLARDHKLILHYNKGYERIKGLLCDEAVKKNVLKVIQADLLKERIDNFVSKVLNGLDHLNLMIILSSIYDETPLEMLNHETIENVIRLNLTVSTSLTLLIGRLMKMWGGGLIIVFTDLIGMRSVNPYTGLKPSIPYIVSKAGLTTLIRFSAKYLAPVRVVGIAPGWIDLPEVGEKLRSLAVKTIPLRRFARPEEVIHVVRFVMSNEYINGVIIELSGGL